MKKNYNAPVVQCLGSVEGLTLTNQSDPYSDVPRGQLGNTGDNEPEPEQFS